MKKMDYKFMKKTDIIGSKMYRQGENLHFLCVFFGSGLVEIHNIEELGEDIGVYFPHLQRIIELNKWIEM